MLGQLLAHILAHMGMQLIVTRHIFTNLVAQPLVLASVFGVHIVGNCLVDCLVNYLVHCVAHCGCAWVAH